MLHLEIITPERVAFSGEVDSVVVPGTAGTMEILPQHAAMFAQLDSGEVKIKKSSGETFMAIGGGFIEVKNNKVDVLVTRAVNADELNEQEILNAQKEAQKALESDVTAEERHAAQQLFRRSLVDMRILRKRKTKHLA